MQRITRLVYQNTFVLVSAVAGFFLILIYTHFWGVGVTQDSIVYTSAAKEFGATGSLTFMNNPLVDFPVFYPLFLYSLQLIFKLNLIHAAPFLNGLLFATVIFFCSIIINGIAISRFVKSVLLLFIVFSPSLLEIYSMLWSETLFIVLLLLFFLLLKNYFVSHSFSALMLVAGVTAVSCVTRYAGVTLIATGCLLILLDKSLPYLKKTLHLIAFVIVSSLLLAFNLLRNAHIRGTLTGVRQKGITSLSQNMYYFGKVICDWLPFFKGYYFFASFIAIAVLLSFSIALIYFFRKNSIGSYEKIVIAFFIVYSLFIIITSTLSHFEGINNRLLSPAYVPFLLGVFTIIYSITKRFSFYYQKWFLLLMFLSAFLFFSIYAHLDYLYYLQGKNTGFQGYQNKIWNTSPIAGFLTKNTAFFRKNYTIYSNENGSFYYFSRRACDALPQKINGTEINDFYEEDYVYLVWFNNIHNGEILNLDEVLTHKKMTCIYSFSDGKIFIWKEDEGDYK